MNRTDHDLAAACLAGDESAWRALVERYRRIVYSVAFSYRLPAEDRADVLQSVWLELIRELPRLRDAGALGSWLLTVSTRKCYLLKRQEQKRREQTTADDAPLEEMPEAAAAPEWPADIERSQALRVAIDRLPTRCRTLVRMLFYADPPVPYSEVARVLGLAEGSIGFTRGACLDKLRRNLKRAGF